MPLGSRFQIYAGLSVLSTVWAVKQAHDSSPNFYSAAVFLSRSSHSIFILVNFVLLAGYIAGRLIQWCMFGQLRTIEIEHLHERAWFAITETALALTIFRDDFSASILINLIALLWLKCWHWISTDRIEWIDQTLELPRFFHQRLVLTILSLLAVDVHISSSSLGSVMSGRGSPMMLMFGFEYFQLALCAMSSLCRYGVSLYEIRYYGGEAQDDSGGGTWERKGMAVLFLSVSLDISRLILYLLLFAVLLSKYGLPLHLLRDIYICFRSVLVKFRDLARYMHATTDMDHRYPLATQAELDRGDGICIICREEMIIEATSHGADHAARRRVQNNTPRKLPCSHIFHLRCLRAWLERQQSCPTCRRTVFQTTAQGPPAGTQGAAFRMQRPQFPVAGPGHGDAGGVPGLPPGGLAQAGRQAGGPSVHLAHILQALRARQPAAAQPSTAPNAGIPHGFSYSSLGANSPFPQAYMLSPEQHGLVPAPARGDGQPGGGNFVLLQPMAGLSPQPILAQLPLGWQLPPTLPPGTPSGQGPVESTTRAPSAAASTTAVASTAPSTTDSRPGEESSLQHDSDDFTTSMRELIAQQASLIRRAEAALRSAEAALEARSLTSQASNGPGSSGPSIGRNFDQPGHSSSGAASASTSLGTQMTRTRSAARATEVPRPSSIYRANSQGGPVDSQVVHSKAVRVEDVVEDSEDAKR